MGGSGSGYWWRWNSRSTTESQHGIDIRWLKKHGHLRPGMIGSLSWSRRGEQTGSIGYRMEAEKMILNYRHRPNGGEWEEVKQNIYFDRTPCNYGGYRTWFLCPKCCKRVAILYGAGKYFLCRRCHNLTYSSQQQNPLFRCLEQAQKIRERLGGSPCTEDPFPDKPKGMHWKRYSELRGQYEAVVGRMNSLQWVFLSNMKKY